MDEILDSLWLKIEILINYTKTFLDLMLAPLNSLGPAVAIATIAFITVVITKVFTRIYNTKRYKELEQEFLHWFNLRQEALKSDDPEKGKLLAKNIDQAKLNKIYYDYFFEALLKGLVTKYLPVLVMLAYVNDAYQPGNLLRLFGRDYVLKLRDLNGQTIVVGAGLWFLVSLIMAYVGWFIIRKIYSKHVSGKTTKSGSHIQKEPNVAGSG